MRNKFQSSCHDQFCQLVTLLTLSLARMHALNLFPSNLTHYLPSDPIILHPIPSRLFPHHLSHDLSIQTHILLSLSNPAEVGGTLYFHITPPSVPALRSRPRTRPCPRLRPRTRPRPRFSSSVPVLRPPSPSSVLRPRPPSPSFVLRSCPAIFIPIFSAFLPRPAIFTPSSPPSFPRTSSPPSVPVLRLRPRPSSSVPVLQFSFPFSPPSFPALQFSLFLPRLPFPALHSRPPSLPSYFSFTQSLSFASRHILFLSVGETVNLTQPSSSASQRQGSTDFSSKRLFTQPYHSVFQLCSPHPLLLSHSTLHPSHPNLNPSHRTLHSSHPNLNLSRMHSASSAALFCVSAISI